MSERKAGLGCRDPLGAELENAAVSTNEIDQYLRTLDEPKRAALAQLRDTIVAIVPDAEQCISYGMPAFRLRGKTIAGFAAFKSHLSYLPHSGSVIPQLAEETEGYTKTKGSLHFPVDKPLPKKLVKKLLDARMAEAFGLRR
jgi:uncharacterized protein YdhG (YjbR/CyaY superfamily)